ncbi:MAG: leucine-rich repeat protein [Lachnospiraceae bacterium]|nr:leucine-rich repeat protein [Lachnospiraceae bacterium]
MKVEQMMKQMWVASLMLIIGVMSLTIPSKAATLTEGDYEYEILEDGTAKITRYIGSDTEITTPSTLGGNKVTVIGDTAFMNCGKITKVTIPDGVTKIGETGSPNAVYGAFFECTALKEIVIPASVKSIAQYAFLRCTSLEQLNLPNGLEQIGWGAFEGCSSLDNVGIPASVTLMDYGVFGNCDLDNITVDPDNKNYYSVDNCLIDTRKNELIQGCYNSKIPDTVTEIGWNAFAGCKRLTSIVIPESVKNMGPQVFADCINLEEVVLPDGLTTIAGREFAGCSSLQKINLPKSLLGIEGSAFNYCKQLKNIMIPEGVKDIGNDVFYECTGLESVVIPDSVTDIGLQAFRGCSSLRKVKLSSNIKAIPAGMFLDCSLLTEIDIPDGVESIGGQRWGGCAFEGCIGLQKVTIPDSVKYINEDEFQCRFPAEDDGDDDGIHSYWVRIPEALKIYTTPGSYAAEWVKENAPDNDASVTSTPTPQPTPNPDSQPATPNQTPTQTPSGATPAQTGQNTVKLPAAKGTVLTVPEWQCQVRVTSDVAADPTVEYLAITNKKTATIKVPDSVAVDGITYKVTAIAGKALAGNKKVKKIVLGVNVTSIGKNAFAKCKNLKKIEVKSNQWSKKSVGKNAFKGTSRKLVVKVPKKMASTYKKYIKGKGNKTVRVK